MRHSGTRRGLAGLILLLEGCFEQRDLDVVCGLKLTPVVHEVVQVEMLEHARLSAPLDVYMKLNTGMNRLGFDARDAVRKRDVYQRLSPQQYRAIDCDDPLCKRGSRNRRERPDRRVRN